MLLFYFHLFIYLFFYLSIPFYVEKTDKKKDQGKEGVGMKFKITATNLKNLNRIFKKQKKKKKDDFCLLLFFLRVNVFHDKCERFSSFFFLFLFVFAYVMDLKALESKRLEKEKNENKC